MYKYLKNIKRVDFDFCFFTPLAEHSKSFAFTSASRLRSTSCLKKIKNVKNYRVNKNKNNSFLFFCLKKKELFYFMFFKHINYYINLLFYYHCFSFKKIQYIIIMKTFSTCASQPQSASEGNVFVQAKVKNFSKKNALVATSLLSESLTFAFSLRESKTNTAQVQKHVYITKGHERNNNLIYKINLLLSSVAQEQPVQSTREEAKSICFCFFCCFGSSHHYVSECNHCVPQDPRAKERKSNSQRSTKFFNKLSLNNNMFFLFNNKNCLNNMIFEIYNRVLFLNNYFSIFINKKYKTFKTDNFIKNKTFKCSKLTQNIYNLKLLLKFQKIFYCIEMTYFLSKKNFYNKRKKFLFFKIQKLLWNHFILKKKSFLTLYSIIFSKKKYTDFSYHYNNKLENRKSQEGQKQKSKPNTYYKTYNLQTWFATTHKQNLQATCASQPFAPLRGRRSANDCKAFAQTKEEESKNFNNIKIKKNIFLNIKKTQISSTLFYAAHLTPSFVLLTSFLKRNKIQECKAKNFFSNNMKKSNRKIEIILGPLKFGLSFELHCNIFSYYTFNYFIKQSIKTIKSNFLFYDCINFYKKKILNNYSCSSFAGLSPSETSFVLLESFFYLRSTASSNCQVALLLSLRKRAKEANATLLLLRRSRPASGAKKRKSKSQRFQTPNLFCFNNLKWRLDLYKRTNVKVSNMGLNHIIRKDSEESQTEKRSKLLKKILIKKNIIYELLLKKQNLVINNQNFFYVLKQLIEILKQIRPFKFILHLKRYFNFNKNLKNFIYFNFILKSFYPYDKTSNFVLNSFEIENYLKLKMFFLITKFTKINMSFNKKEKNKNIEYIKLYNIGFYYGSFLLNFNINIFDIIDILYKNFYRFFLCIFHKSFTPSLDKRALAFASLLRIACGAKQIKAQRIKATSKIDDYLRLTRSKIYKNKRFRKKLKFFRIRTRKSHTFDCKQSLQVLLNKNSFKTYKINLFKYKFFKFVLEKLFLNKKIKKKKYLRSFHSLRDCFFAHRVEQKSAKSSERSKGKANPQTKTSIFSLCTKYEKSLKNKNLFLYDFKKFLFNYSFFTVYKNFQIIKIQNKSKFFLIKKWHLLKTIYQKISNYIWKKNKISFFYETNYFNIFYNSKFANCLIIDKNNIFVLNSKYNIINKFVDATFRWNKKFNLNCKENIFCLKKKKILSLEKMYSLKKNGLNFKGFFLFFISNKVLDIKKEKFNIKESLIINYLIKKEIFILKNHFFSCASALLAERCEDPRVQNFHSEYFNFKINTGLIPSKKFLKKHLILLKNIILKYNSETQKKLLYKLSFRIMNWSYYYKIVTNSQLFYYCDSFIYKFIWKWACHNHPNKSKKWIQQKYFFSLKNKKWVFAILPKNFDSKSSKKDIFYLPFHSFLINF
uniref:Group II intron maturase-specific domain-containing protein n=1 Tax=Pseudopediastrum integrum TaxID=271402 RepID=A0A2U8GJC7_9CHLO|nr:hypothetical protein [Pseudopediastrum integrum]AWI68774.1 hypothetical protein [Pseudopediastrum integrum]